MEPNKSGPLGLPVGKPFIFLWASFLFYADVTRSPLEFYSCYNFQSRSGFQSMVRGPSVAAGMRILKQFLPQ